MAILLNKSVMRQFQRRGSTPGEDCTDSERVDQWLFRVHIAILVVTGALCVYQMRWAPWQLLVVACHTPYFIVRMRPSILMVWQIMLWCYLSWDAVVNNAPQLGMWVTFLQVCLTITAAMFKRAWYGLHLEHC